jgi:hypothetical protein
MVTNSCAAYTHHWATAYPDRLGHLYSPGGQRGPWRWLPFALDSGAWSAHLNGTPFDGDAYRALLEWGAGAQSGLPPKRQAPLFAVVPDVVSDREGTLESWNRWAGEVAAYNFRPAMAVQDGMTPDDVPAEAEVIFVGGSTAFKWSTMETWCNAFPGRVHVGRVNTYKRLRQCQDAGAVSCDGTGWFRGDKEQLGGLYRWLREEAGEIPREIQHTIGVGCE